MENDSPRKKLILSIIEPGFNGQHKIHIQPSLFMSEDKNLFNDYLSCLLYTAAIKGNCELVAKLLECEDVNVNWQDGFGNNILIATVHEAAIFQKEDKEYKDYKKICKLLLNEDRIDVNWHPIGKISPLLMSVRQNFSEISKLLLSHKNINVGKEKDGKQSMLTWAITHINLEIFCLILKKRSHSIAEIPNDKYKKMSDLAKDYMPSNWQNNPDAVEMIRIICDIEQILL